MTGESSTDIRFGPIEAGLLVAYADGCLPPEQARELESALRDHPEAREALSLMRQSAVAGRHAFDTPLSQPVPDRLRSLFVLQSGSPGLLSRRLLPLAASLVALAVGLTSGYLLGRPGEDGAAMHLAAGPATVTSEAFESALWPALEGELPGAEYTDAARGTTGVITLLSPIRTSFGLTCREFRHVVKDRQASTTTEDGLACQRGNGGWEVIVLAAHSR